MLKFNKFCQKLWINGFLIAFGLALPTGGHADDNTKHQTKLDVKLGPLPVGIATFDIALNGNTYQLQGRGKTAGIAQVFSPGRGDFTSVGEVQGSAVKSLAHTVFFKERKKKASLTMSFADDKVKGLTLNPDKRAKRARSSKWIPILPEHMAGVIDPASSLIVPADDAARENPTTICNRTFEIFDGESRYDMRLSYKKTKTVKTKGYEGPAYVCKLKYVPIAGHKRGRKNIERMRKNERMEIWLAPIADTQVYTFIRIEVGTDLGKFLAVPRYFGQVASN